MCSAKRVMTRSVVTRFFILKGVFIMPKTKFQGIIFGLIMSITMAYGMEVYNVALKEGGLSQMTNRVFWDALLEAAYMWIFVFFFSNLWGNRIGHKLAEKICRENPKIQILIIRRDPQERTRILIERFGDIWDRDLKMESPELPAFEE